MPAPKPYLPIATPRNVFVVCMITFLLGMPLVLPAQQSQLSIKGSITSKTGESYPYRLVLDIAGNTVKGYSVTSQEGMEFRARVKGMINQDKKTLAITETGTMGALADSFEMCFLSTVLQWKTRKDKYVISGPFVGRNKNKAICSEGKALFEIPLTDAKILKLAPPPDTVAKPAVPDDPEKITEGKDKKITFTTRQCTLYIWDGGVIDDDVVTVLLNGREILTNYVLTAEKKTLTIPLTEKTNTITIVAGDEGTAPPNTAQMLLTDGTEQHKVTAYNKKGKTASVVITTK